MVAPAAARAITGTEGASEMPPEGEKLTATEITLIRRWIDEGAKYPADDKPEADPRDHWAFRTPIRPPVPASDWAKNPVDAFLAADGLLR